jgi:D-galactarolactone cycloisomerase
VKIVAVEAVLLGVPWQPTDPPSPWTERLGTQVLVRVVTDEGPDEAIRQGRALARYDLAWLEEPVWPPEDYRGLAQVAAALDTPIAAGENEAMAIGFRDMLLAGAVDILQPSPTKVGARGESKKIAALGAAWNVPVVPHSFYFGPGLAAALHLAASTPGVAWVEWPMGELVTPLLKAPIRPEGGWLAPSAGPGLGGRPSAAALRHHRLGAVPPAFTTG